MEAINKANNLIHKHLNYFGTTKDEFAEEQARQSAIITVEEILSDFSGYRVKSYLTVRQAKELSDFWEEVLQELNNKQP